MLALRPLSDISHARTLHTPSQRPIFITQAADTNNGSDNNTPGTPSSSAAAVRSSSSYATSRILGTSLSSMRPPALTRAPEVESTPQHFGGALTTLIFGASLLSERLNGVGIVQNLELHNKGFHPLLLGAIVLLMCASAWPEKRELQNPTKLVRVQMAGARVAYLGLAGAIAAEIFTGKGILTLLDFETGVEAVSDVEAVLAFMAMLFLTGPQSKVAK